MVKEIKSDQELRDIIKKNTSPIVIDFYADWCGPCKRLAPKFQEMENKYNTVQFYKINTDNEKLNKACEIFEIKSLPTLVLIKDEQVVSTIVGADEKKIEDMIKNKFL